MGEYTTKAEGLKQYYKRKKAGEIPSAAARRNASFERKQAKKQAAAKKKQAKIDKALKNA
jgi:hypothetical protein